MIMYLSMSLLALLSMALAMRGCSEQDPLQRELLYSAFFIVTISAACYLTMATGNGLLVLRKSGAGLIFIFITHLTIATGNGLLVLRKFWARLVREKARARGRERKRVICICI
jgi:bacteriorhodopsin